MNNEFSGIFTLQMSLSATCASRRGIMEKSHGGKKISDLRKSRSNHIPKAKRISEMVFIVLFVSACEFNR